jgi:Spy/CpxP family protein refolding chaperone
MAIQGVKGAPGTYYVIKANVNPVSQAAYWSNLVTQQKKELFQNALSIATAEAKTEASAYEAQLKAFSQAQRDLGRERSKFAREISKLSTKQAESVQKLKEKQLERESTSTGSSSGTGGASKAETDLERLYQRRAALYDDLARLSVSAEALGPESELGAPYQQASDDIDKEIKRLTTEIRNREASIETGQTTTGGTTSKSGTSSRTTTSGLVVPEGFEALSLEEQIGELQKELDAITAQEQALQAPTGPQTNILGRTRELAGYGSFTPQENEAFAARAAQMERNLSQSFGSPELVGKGSFRGGDVLPPMDLMDEPQPQGMLGSAGVLPLQEQPMPNDIVEPAGRFQQDLQPPQQPFGTPEFAPMPTELDYLESISGGPSLKMPDQKEIKQKQTEQLIQQIEAGTNKTREEAKQMSSQATDASDYRNLVKQLYSTAQGKDASQRVKVRDNAYRELEKTYGDDKETFSNAVELLITLDALEMGTLPE